MGKRKSLSRERAASPRADALGTTQPPPLTDPTGNSTDNPGQTVHYGGAASYVGAGATSAPPELSGGQKESQGTTNAQLMHNFLLGRYRPRLSMVLILQSLGFFYMTGWMFLQDNRAGRLESSLEGYVAKLLFLTKLMAVAGVFTVAIYGASATFSWFKSTLLPALTARLRRAIRKFRRWRIQLRASRASSATEA